ncbi:hypothetical protein A3A21_03685 [Candidatus Jorgensenbacteria bacterium RIFCSPLOWO2_01_FULL_45_25b]|uniref:Uncharacterized protein n=1 Tax=Candidatus Jorgensenbacteria bacterium RIFCSPLOWO2_01_FULL_45_25b TaxID=1798471 RepID=A0A1F6BXJ3_9BACT|nr:MAG: hypothetical protein A3A21_03685 [Candidatus Jorgensenbacteria bacterium RIFCSPLOWO2_01_FULL_45_25b]HLD33966.1 hypothetical protein [Candidatus Nanoarchaeia archaeon]
MNESLIVKRLVTVDRELHNLLDELRMKHPKMSLSQIRRLMKSASDEDPTVIVRKMRNKEYDL